MVNLVIDDTGVTEGQKIDNMEEILGKLQTCGILAVNQNESKYSNFKRSKSTMWGSFQLFQPTRILLVWLPVFLCAL